VIADEVDLGHQNDEGIDLFRDLLPQEGIGGHSLQEEGDQGHHHLDVLTDHVQNLQTRRNLMRLEKIKIKLTQKVQ